jgi:hypothetical protein
MPYSSLYLSLLTRMLLVVFCNTHHTGSAAQPSATASTADTAVSDEAALALLEQHNLQLLTSMSLIEWDLPRTYPTLGAPCATVVVYVASSVVCAVGRNEHRQTCCGGVCVGLYSLVASCLVCSRLTSNHCALTTCALAPARLRLYSAAVLYPCVGSSISPHRRLLSVHII